VIETGETLVDLLRRRADLEGERIAFLHLEDGESRERTLTFSELDRRARSLAAFLVASGASGERALLLYPQGPEYLVGFFGCLYAGVVAVPLFPPVGARFLPRLRSIAGDSGATFALTTSDVLAGSSDLAGTAGLASLRVVATDTLAADGAAEADGWRRPRGLAPDSLAFLQYTSGSTAAPRGVMVSHGNLAHNERELQRCWRHSARSVIVSWLPLFHDMGLVGIAVQAVYVGAPCILMSPAQFLERPLRWLRAISRHRATTSGAPNFAYDLCAEKITEEDKAGLDLSSWSVAFNGSEPVRAATLARFEEAFAGCGFRREAWMAAYGLAESTLGVSLGTRGPSTVSVSASALEEHRVVEAEGTVDGARVLVSCGPAFGETDVALVDPETRVPVAAGEVGEVWVSSPSVARGYWRREEESARVFRATIAGGDGRSFLRTGDLGFLRGDELFVTGRLKDLLIVHGRNHYPQDLEWTVESSHASLRAGGTAAFSIEADGEERVVVAAEVERAFDAAAAPAVFDAMRRALASEHELRLHAAVLLERSALPKTTSGKVQRSAARAAYLAGELAIVAATGTRADPGRFTAPRTRAEEVLAGIWVQFLHVERVGVHDNFFELGGDSILAVQIALAALEAGIAFTPRNLFEHPTIAELAALACASGSPSEHAPASRRYEPAGLHDVALDPVALGKIAEAVAPRGKGARR
jgi:acyl-CoA synthetase (AMP-forming)/AMP-acid ligase II/aryl carrier-like protein